MPRIVYFNSADITSAGDGGKIIARNHVRQIAATEGVDLLISCVCEKGNEERLHEFAESIGAIAAPITWSAEESGERTKIGLMAAYQIVIKPYIDRKFTEFVDGFDADAVVVEYLYSVLSIPTAYSRGDIKKIIITQNPESKFLRQHRLQKGRRIPNMSEFRLFMFERRVYQQSDVVVALTEGDAPARRNLRVIQPVLDMSTERWSGGQSDRMLFVGNVAHYPNKLAVQWIVDELHPALRGIGCSSKIDIIGASRDDFPHAPDDLNFHGIADRDLVDRLICETGLFLCPIKNEFGSKIKLLECLSHGTPFAATKPSHSGLGFLGMAPLLFLDDPHASAINVASLIASDHDRESMSKHLEEASQMQSKIQSGSWAEILSNLVQSSRQNRSSAGA